MIRPIFLIALAPAFCTAFMTTSLSKPTSSLQALSIENFRDDIHRQDPYERSKFSYDRDHYYQRSTNDFRDGRRPRTLVNPRNDVYRRSDVINRPRYDDDYRRTHAYGHQRSLVNPRNDVYRRSDVINRPRYDDDYRRYNSYGRQRSLVNPRNDVYARGVDLATENMVDRELAKIQAMGKYAIGNELMHTYGYAPRYNLSKEELACLLLKARLSKGPVNSSWRNNAYRTRGNAGSWVDGQSNMWSEDFWKN